MSGSRQKKIVVLGGGACGMSAPLELSRQGASVVVLEREPRVGGLCGTHERDGFRFDFGGHRFMTRNGAIDELVRSLVGEDLLERQRRSVFLNGGKRYSYPLEIDDILRQYGPLRGARALASYLGQALRQHLAPGRDDSFRDWVTHRFGAELYGTFFGPCNFHSPPGTMDIEDDEAVGSPVSPVLGIVALHRAQEESAPAPPQ